jgi:cytochrome c-type biogenesis protein CcmH
MSASRWLILAAILTVGLALGWAARPQPATNADRVDRIAAELRCPVCQGLSVKDSSSETARAMRSLVAQRVAEGKTDDEIRAEIARGYGDWVLLSPPLVSPSGLIWVVPFAAIVLGGLLALRRARAPVDPGQRDLTVEERQGVDALLASDEP